MSIPYGLGSHPRWKPLLLVTVAVLAVLAMATTQVSSATSVSTSLTEDRTTIERADREGAGVEGDPEWLEVRQSLRKLAGDRLARLHLEHDPRAHLVLAMTGASVPAEVSEFVAATEVPVTVEMGAVSSVEDLIALTDRYIDRWVEAHPDFVGVDVRPVDGVVLIDSTSETSDISDVVEDISNSGLSVERRFVEGEVGDDRRGGYLTDSGCTVGFSVVRTGGTQRGTTTAGHCDNSYQWRNLSGGSWNTTTFQAQRRNAVSDIQWSTTSPAPQPRFHADQVSTYRVVTGSVGRTDMDGDYVCHNGRTSWYSCGTVVSITYRPTYDGACPGTCDAVWPKVEGASLKCGGGDSGGPWFNSTSAYGIHKGSSRSGDDCNWSIFTPIGKFSQMDMQVLAQ